MEAKEMVLMQTRDGKVREREKGLSCKDGKVDNMVRYTDVLKTCSKAVYKCNRRTHHNHTQTQKLSPIT